MKTRLTSLCAFVAALSFSMASNAEKYQWIPFPEREDGTKILVEIGNAKVVGNNITLWLRKETKDVGSTVVFETNDCVTLRRKVHERLYFWNDDELITHNKYKNPKWEFINPGSLAEEFSNVACGVWLLKTGKYNDISAREK